MVKFLDLTCRLLSGQEVKLSIPGDISIGDIKALIAAECDLSPDNQRLIFKGQMLAEGRTLESYSVTSGSTIHVIANSSGASSNQDQSRNMHSQSQARNPLNFGDAMASSMNMLMNEFLTKSGGDGSSGSNRGQPSWDGGNRAEVMKPLLMEGMKIAQRLSKGEGDIGQFATKILSNVMSGRFDRPVVGTTPADTTVSREEPFSATTTTAAAAVRETHEAHVDSNGEAVITTEHGARSALLSARDTINRVCTSLYNLPSSAGQAHQSAPNTCSGDSTGTSIRDACMMEWEDDLLIRTRNGIFLDDATRLNSRLPWASLERLENAISNLKGAAKASGQDRTDIGGFMGRYDSAIISSSAITKELVDWSDRSSAINSERLSAISMMYALQSALQSELTLITSVLSNQASQLEMSVDEIKAASASPVGLQSTRDASSSSSQSFQFQGRSRAGQDQVSTLNGGGSAADHNVTIHPTPATSNVTSRFSDGASRRDENSPKLFDMLLNMGRMAESALRQPGNQASTNAAGSSQANDDILLDSTELRILFNKYRNSVGFKSRMDEFTQKTRKLGENYCTGFCPE